MSVGKILRKIVKKWLKKDNETGVVEPTEYELYTETNVPLATGHLDSEPCLQDCMLCIERDGTYGGDLNRNLHISHEMGFSNGGGIRYGKYRLDEWDCELSETSYSSSCPLHGLSNFMGDSTEFPFDSTCHSSQSPVPLCVCETCYIFVSSHRLPSTPSASPRIPAADAAGQPLCDADTRCWFNQCPTGQPDSGKVSNKTVGLGMMITKESKPADCSEDSSISVTSNRQFHSVTNPKSPPSSSIVEQLPLKTTTMGGGHGGGGGGHAAAHLPQSVHASLDGEEGFGEARRRLQCINRRWEDTSASGAARKSFRPPPNKTICHVAK